MNDPAMSATSVLLQVDVEAFRESFVPAIQSSLQYFGAEFQVVIAAMAILLLDLFLPRRVSHHLAWVALAACVVPLSSIGYHAEASRSLFLGMTAIDPFASFFKTLFLLGMAVIVLMSYVSRPLQDRRMGEYYFLLLAAAFGAMLMASATHFLTIFLAIELLSICSYVLVGYVRRRREGVVQAADP